jgi:hypothetical protein
MQECLKIKFLKTAELTIWLFSKLLFAQSDWDFFACPGLSSGRLRIMPWMLPICRHRPAEEAL